MTKLSYLTLSIAALVACSISHAVEVKPATDGSVIYDAGVDGLEMEWNADGSMKRVSSTWRHPVIIADRPGITKAQIIAEEKAKAAIVRYMYQITTSDRKVAEITEDLAATSAKTGSGEVLMSTEATRKMSESLKETTRSFAAGRLRGIIVLEKGFDPKTGEVWVTVGMSEKSMTAAAGLADSINAASGDTLWTQRPANARKSGVDGSSSVHSGLLPQGAEVRRNKINDW